MELEEKWVALADFMTAAFPGTPVSSISGQICSLRASQGIVAASSAEAAHIGNRALLHYCDVRFCVTLPESTDVTNACDSVRIVGARVLGPVPNGTILLNNASVLLETNPFGTNLSFQMPINKDRSQEIEFFMDEYFDLNASCAGTLLDQLSAPVIKTVHRRFVFDPPVDIRYRRTVDTTAGRNEDIQFYAYSARQIACVWRFQVTCCYTDE